MNRKAARRNAPSRKGEFIVETIVPEAPFRGSTRAYGARRIARQF
jgi:hypothetical protein